MSTLRAALLGLAGGLALAATLPALAAAERGGADRALLSAASVDLLAASVRRYRAIAAADGWPAIPEGPALRRGAAGTRVALLRERLRITGDLGPSPLHPDLFDGAVEDAVRRFQRRHGLIASGVVYTSTRDVLNVPAGVRLAQLEANLARLRALLADGAGRQGREVVVNIPAYELQAVDGGRVELHSRVVVGRPDTPTPVLRIESPSVTFLPEWRVPVGVVARDIVPVMQVDPDFLTRQRIRMFASADGRSREADPASVNWFMPQAGRFVFRQEPGPHNAMGVVRINMPNAHVVLIHDTPEKAQFERQDRTFSAGCVRVERSLDLAAWLLRGHDGWHRGQIERTIADGRERTVRLPVPVPVRLVYLTAWVGGNDVTEFRPDIYRHDSWPTAPPSPEGRIAGHPPKGDR